MNNIKSLLVKVYKMIKTLTFWSIIIGLELTGYINVIANFIQTWRDKGWRIAVGSPQYFLFVVSTLVVFATLGLFYTAERKLTTKAENSTNEITDKLDGILNGLKILTSTLTEVVNRNSEELKRIGSFLAPPHIKEGGTNPDNQTQNKTE
jgi:hypothetical protein